MDKNGKEKSTNKKKLMRTKQEMNRIKIIIVVVVLLVAALTYYIIDSGSYVASVNGSRISNYEYQFFLSRQKYSTETKEGIIDKTAAEKKAFWTKTVDGQNPWESAKNEALNASKDYMIQIIKANEMGLKIDANIKSEVTSFLESSKSSIGNSDAQFASYVKSVYGITVDELRKISENLMLIDRFKTEYVKKNYTATPVSEADAKAYYNKDPKAFDKVDISYVSFYKLDQATGKELAADQLAAKKKKADEALSKIQSGENVDKVIAEYTEEKPSATTSGAAVEAVGKASVTYSPNSSVQNLIDYVFSAKVGDATIIDTQYVTYVVKVDKRTAFEDVKATVTTQMTNEAKEKFYDDELDKWAKDSRYNIIKNDRVYDAISYK
ncbi:MAG: peptidylprolyl isomerase [Clostridia bacterium]|nr:peptidylprolyl isomerase [Clostridia bacterium]